MDDILLTIGGLSASIGSWSKLIVAYYGDTESSTVIEDESHSEKDAPACGQECCVQTILQIYTVMGFLGVLSRFHQLMKKLNSKGLESAVGTSSNGCFSKAAD